MSIFQKELVQQIADSIQIPVKDEICSILIQDVEYRLREIIHESVKFKRHSKRKQLTPQDINSALYVKNIQPLYGYNHKPEFRHQNGIYYLEDYEMDIEEIINRPLPPVPLETTFTAHWLAIEGTQPRIIQNPVDMVTAVEQKQAVKEQDIVKVKQTITQELQLYYEKITECIIGDEKQQQLAIESISTDPGIQPLMPYFTQFVNDTTVTNLKNSKVLIQVLKMIASLLKNKDLFMDPYLHQFVPGLITIVVRKGIANATEMAIENDSEMEHELLSRKMAADLLYSVVYKFGTQYPNLQSRVVKTVMRVLTGVPTTAEGEKPKQPPTEGSYLGAFWFLKRTSVLVGVDLSDIRQKAEKEGWSSVVEIIDSLKTE